MKRSNKLSLRFDFLIDTYTFPIKSAIRLDASKKGKGYPRHRKIVFFRKTNIKLAYLAFLY